MNQAEIIAMATEAGLNSYRIAPGDAVAVWELAPIKSSAARTKSWEVTA